MIDTAAHTELFNPIFLVRSLIFMSVDKGLLPVKAGESGRVFGIGAIVAATTETTNKLMTTSIECTFRYL